MIEDYILKIEAKIEKEIKKAKKRFGEDFNEKTFRETNSNVLREKTTKKMLESKWTKLLIVKICLLSII